MRVFETIGIEQFLQTFEGSVLHVAPSVPGALQRRHFVVPGPFSRSRGETGVGTHRYPKDVGWVVTKYARGINEPRLYFRKIGGVWKLEGSATGEWTIASATTP